jgi:1-acyl-sn-glycerol-3-phosphate acyltransferase
MLQHFLAWWFFKVRGWKIEGSFPYSLKQSVIIAGPHTHNVDFFLGLAVRKKLHFEFVQFLGKKELFNPITGWFFRLLGGHPVNRGKKNNMVDQVVALYHKHERFHIALSPEGTRTKVFKFRTGFYHIAKNAKVPILMVGFDFGQRRVVFADPIFPTDNEQADMRLIVDFFKQFKGFVPEYGITDDIDC